MYVASGSNVLHGCLPTQCLERAPHSPLSEGCGLSSRWWAIGG